MGWIESAEPTAQGATHLTDILNARGGSVIVAAVQKLADRYPRERQRSSQVSTIQPLGPVRLAASCTVTIGYEAPWRQVHALLLMAAERTSNILQEPKAYVLQRALSDFYLEYTLIVRLVNPHLRVETLSELHGNVLDAFNECGVQIMSLNFMMQPDTSIVVPWYKWHEPPENGSAAKQHRIAARDFENSG